MATTKLRDRIIAGAGALFFLISASAFTVFVLVDMFNGSSDSTAQDTAQATCEANKTEIKLDAPKVFIPEGAVGELKHEDLEAGTGAAAKSGDCLIMKYYGTLAKDGTLFDENYTKPAAFAFTLGKGEVIKGWDQGLEGMKVGGTRRLLIPSALGYGAQTAGSIPANADLVFTVELLRIK